MKGIIHVYGGPGCECCRKHFEKQGKEQFKELKEVFLKIRKKKLKKKDVKFVAWNTPPERPLNKDEIGRIG